MEFLVLFLLLVFLFLGVIIVRALMFTPKKGVKEDQKEITFEREEAIKALQKLITFKTVSYHDKEKEDDEQFKGLIDALPSLYGEVFKVCEKRELEDRALLFKWKGKSEKNPTVLMAHYDVVPADEDKWDKDPFSGIIEDGVLWGRGSLDTKVTFNGILSAANKLIKDGFVPEKDIYFAFSGGEEVNGNGAKRIVEYFKENKIDPALVVDEGGAVVENVFPGVKKPCALIGIAEKGLMNVRFKSNSMGGHASAPKHHTPVGLISRACYRIEKKPFKSHLTAPVKEMFDTLGRHSSFVYRIIFSNLWCFKPVLSLLAQKSGGEMNALMRTTVAFTQASGSKAPNVIPPTASMVANIRLNPEDSIEKALEYFKKTIKDENVNIEFLEGNNPSLISTTKCEGFEKLSQAVASTWKGSILSPYLMVQCSDSRHYGEISDKVFRFSAMDLTSEERATIHGHNERIRIETAERTVEFYIRLIEKC